ncbi:MAG: hypothetical protein PWP24_307 [Clostridiales bacterium]|nr:hypothetical protein [Clostridiales bacterium]
MNTHKMVTLTKAGYCLFLLVSILFIGYRLITPAHLLAATKDKKAPKIEVSISTTEFTNHPLTVTLQVTDTSGISLVKWGHGAKKISYFTKSGKKLKLDKDNKTTFQVKKNGIYTIYAKDKAGNSIKKKIKITNIDTISPSVQIINPSTTYTNQSIDLTVQANDDCSGIRSIKYAKGEKVASDFLQEGTYVSYTEDGISHFYATENGIYSVYVEDNAGNYSISNITIDTIDINSPKASPSYSVMNQTASVVLNAVDAESGIKQAMYIKGDYPLDSDIWNSTANMIVDAEHFQINAAGTYSILIEDNAGNRVVKSLDVVMEFRAAWISYLEFLKTKDLSEEAFKDYVDIMFDQCVQMQMNAVIVQVRPFSDAMYPSKYFPWSYYASGEQGKSLSYDPLAYMIDAAHERNLSFHAWINPYRVTLANTDTSGLSADNPARLWRENEDTSRYVLTYGKNLYYNPSIPEVQKLVINGVKELVKNYKIDGIHFDDYFYPNLGSNYKKNFDAVEYNAYKEACTLSDKEALSIADWRRQNVSNLVKKTYQAIKAINKDCVFGISPAGNISNLLSDSNYYVDIKTWMSSSEYLDYICPQIYWSFEHKTAAFDKVLNNWIALKTSDTVNLYVGLAVYRAGISKTTAEKTYGDLGWAQSSSVLKKQVLYSRNTGVVDGYLLFRYDFMIGNTAKKEMKNLISILE